MSEQTQQDVRRLLKTLGIQADETIMAYIARHTEQTPLQIRITLEDVTDYSETPPAEMLRVVVEGSIER